MKLNRCPWCGKKLERRLDLHVKQKKTPLFFRFARCHHCGHNYGQHIYSSKYMRFEFFYSRAAQLSNQICVLTF